MHAYGFIDPLYDFESAFSFWVRETSFETCPKDDRAGNITYRNPVRGLLAIIDVGSAVQLFVTIEVVGIRGYSWAMERE